MAWPALRRLAPRRRSSAASGRPGVARTLSGTGAMAFATVSISRGSRSIGTNTPSHPAAMYCSARATISSTACSGGTSLRRDTSIRALMNRSVPARCPARRAASTFAERSSGVPFPSSMLMPAGPAFHERVDVLFNARRIVRIAAFAVDRQRYGDGARRASRPPSDHHLHRRAPSDDPARLISSGSCVFPNPDSA